KSSVDLSFPLSNPATCMPSLASSAEIIPPAHPIPTTTASTLSNFLAILTRSVSFIAYLLKILVHIRYILYYQFLSNKSFDYLGIASAAIHPCLRFLHIMDPHKLQKVLPYGVDRKNKQN